MTSQFTAMKYALYNHLSYQYIPELVFYILLSTTMSLEDLVLLPKRRELQATFFENLRYCSFCIPMHGTFGIAPPSWMILKSLEQAALEFRCHHRQGGGQKNKAVLPFKRKQQSPTWLHPRTVGWSSWGRPIPSFTSFQLRNRSTLTYNQQEQTAETKRCLRATTCWCCCRDGRFLGMDTIQLHNS